MQNFYTAFIHKEKKSELQFPLLSLYLATTQAKLLPLISVLLVQYTFKHLGSLKTSYVIIDQIMVKLIMETSILETGNHHYGCKQNRQIYNPYQ